MVPPSLSDGSRYIGPLRELAVELIARAEGFRRSLPMPIAAGLADLVRSMNCYYSNLIEGHDTHPIDVERVLAQGFSAEPDKRNVQLEARAHIAVQVWLDGGGLASGAAMTAEGIAEIHRRFFALMAAEFAVVPHLGTGERVPATGGAWRRPDGEPDGAAGWRSSLKLQGSDMRAQGIGRREHARCLHLHQQLFGA